MVKAYVLIEMVAGYSTQFVEAMASRPGVTLTDRVTGPYDVLVVVQAEDLNSLSRLVQGEIHTQQGVVRTTTCVAIG